MHHRPSGPPLSARITGSLTRCSLLLRAALRRTAPGRLGRLAFGALVTTTVVGLVLAIPVVSGGTSPAVELDSSSTSAATRSENSPVVMGLDGRPVSSSDFAGVTTSGSVSAEPRTSDVAADASDDVAAAPVDPTEASTTVPTPAPGTTGSAPAGSSSTGGTTTPGTSPAGSPSSSGPGTDSAPLPPTEPTTAEPDDAPAPPPAAPVDPASEALALVDAERAAVGCGALVPEGGLAAAAQAHSAAMSEQGVLGVEGLDLPGQGGTAAVAQGVADAPSVVAGWLADPEDGAAIRDCSRTSVGIAVVDGWWTLLLT